MEQEDYLETIYKLAEKQDFVRISDLAKELKLSKPSVTQMIQRLGKEGFILHQSYAPLKLTAKGRRIGRKIAERHRVLEEFFTILKIPRHIREKDIHGIEHCLSPLTLSGLKKTTKFLRKHKFRS